ncbi:2-hydroxy-3-oxopropionate reductase [Planctomycetes bacterium Pan216]|uniref:2-hydroxy-3-oxopropionate reductase n=1 Tax=Kolteria novifilia TaxID=2527975 RepID=A0A518B0X5_9BACT|nr:2-hydroxy-3-oxopropionate reductase [Planctomycetes bacterium Pan216]
MALATCTPGKTRIGWIGTGVMGQSMCGHLVDKGFEATITTRSKSKAEGLLAKGATWAETPKQVAENADVIFAIVGFPKDVREVFLGEQGALAGSKADNILVDMTTSQPSLAEEIAEAAKAKGVFSVDAPVSGGDVGAKNAALSIMVGGEEEAVAAVMPCFEAMGKTIKHQGGPGAGQHTKMVNQMLIAPMMIGVCEALMYAYKSGLDPMKVLESVGSGAAGSWSINNLGPRIIKGDFEPGFYVEHFIKDMGIALAEAEMMGLSLPGLALAKQLYEAVKAQGFGRKGTQALMLALEQMSGIKREGLTD